jgi:hypothetical protein
MTNGVMRIVPFGETFAAENGFFYSFKRIGNRPARLFAQVRLTAMLGQCEADGITK